MNLPFLQPLWYNLSTWYARAKGVKRFVNSIHRRGGKDVNDFSATVQDAVELGGVHYYLLPTRVWAEEIIFKEQFTFKGETKPFWEWVIPKQLNPIKKDKDSCIILPKNGARIQLGGTDDMSFVGRGGKSYTMSEFSRHKEEVTGFIAPILRQSQASFRANGTLMGRENQLFRMLMANKNNPEWFVQWLRPQDTKCYCWVSDEMNINPELMSRIGQIGPNMAPIFNVQDDINSGLISNSLARQEYLNEAVMAFERGYYEYELSCAKGEGRIESQDVKYDPTLPVFTFWDLGRGTSYRSTDSMVCWFAQVPNEDYSDPKQVNLIDRHESVGRGWEYYAQMLNSKGYWYGGHYAPWDIAKGMAGLEKTNHDFARERGINFKAVKRGEKITLDIEQCRRFFKKIWSGTTDEVIKGMELVASYHQKTDKDGLPTGGPDHTIASNTADALRTLVRAFETDIVYPDSQKGNWDDLAKSLSMEGFFN